MRAVMLYWSDECPICFCINSTIHSVDRHVWQTNLDAEMYRNCNAQFGLLFNEGSYFSE